MKLAWRRLADPVWRREHASDLAFVAVWIALTVLALVPVWHQRMLPMLDSPDHLALVRGWHSYHDPSYRIAEHYMLRIRVVPYLLFYFSIHCLTYLFHIEIANKIFLSAYLIVFPLAILALGRALGRSRWLGLGAFALAFNPCWIYGFSSYLMGTALLFTGWAVLMRYLDSGETRRWAQLTLVCLLVYLSHVLAWALFGLGALPLLIIDWRRWRRALAAALAMAPTLLLAAVAFVQDRREHAYMKRSGLHGLWKDVPTSLLEFPRRVMELFPGSVDAWVLATLGATTLVLLVWRPRPQPGPPDAAAALAQRRLGWLLWVLAVSYVALPFTIDRPMSWWYVAARLPAIMAPLLLLLPSRPLRGWQPLALAPVVLACAILPLTLARLYGDFSRRNIGFMRMVDRLPRGAAVLVVPRGLVAHSAESSGDASSSAPVYWHFLSWPMALNGGFSPWLFDQGIPIRPRPGLPTFSMGQSDRFEFSRAPEFDYYLVHDTSDILRPHPSVRELGSASGWTLYQRVAPITDDP